MADLFVAAGYDDLHVTLGPETWQRLTETWAARHVFTHNDGIVDEKYLRKVPTSSARVGQRLVISEALCRRAIDEALVRGVRGTRSIRNTGLSLLPRFLWALRFQT